MTVPLDPRYIPAFSIEDVLLDKDTGAPLSGGLVYFEYDDQRGLLKPIYQITGTSPNYTFTQLPNPMTLSSIGTFEDALDNPVIPYFYPYDANGNVELYYIRVTNSDDVPQFDREAQPYVGDQSEVDVLSVITNEISNPQFIEVLFDTTTASTYTYTVNTVVDSVINIAPDWDIIVSAPAAGTLTVGQVTPSGSLNVVSNPGTILSISSAGLTKCQLRQRIYGSPNLWGSGYLSVTFVAKTYSGTNVTLNMYYSQSNGTVVDQLLVAATLPASGAYGEHPGSALIPPSNSVNTYPNAYIDIYFDIPLSVQIDITSVMVAFTGATSFDNLEYDQESMARQIDHLYHYAYPIVPIGTVIDFFGFDTPLHYYFCDGTAKNRISDYKLYKAMTTTETVSLTSTVGTFTVVDGTKYAIGMKIEGTGLDVAGATVTNIVGTTVTFSPVATATVSSTVRFFAAGNGDGSTTFNLPDLRGYVAAGSGTPTGFTLLSSVGVGGKGGEASHVLTTAQMPSGFPAATIPFNIVGGTGPAMHTVAYAGSSPAMYGVFPVNQTVNFSATGSGTATSLIQPTTLVRKCIRYQ